MEIIRIKENNFKADYNKLVRQLKDSNISEEEKFNLAEEFSQKYVYFDTSKLDNFF